MIKEIYKEEYVDVVDYGLDEDGEETLIEIREKVNAFKISESRFIIYEQDSRHQDYWNRFIEKLEDINKIRAVLGDHFDEVVTSEVWNHRCIRLQELMLK
jgi:hypothetical protein